MSKAHAPASGELVRDTLRSALVLGIETSCDETGVALVRLDAPLHDPAHTPARDSNQVRGQILAQALHSQVDLHARYGGVVPELASRDHILRLTPLIGEVMTQGACSWSDIDAIACTEGPGLAGALLVGASVAEGLSAAIDRPVIGVHHLEGHLLSPLLDPAAAGLDFPFLALLVSGGHTQIMRVDALGAYTLLGDTIDDAAGEAFDKSAQLLGLGYPGGPQISRWASRGVPGRFKLPRPLLRKPGLDVSFAGLKTAVLTHVQRLRLAGELDEQARADMAAEVQAAIVDVLAARCERAIRETGLRALVVAGGVGANQELRRRLDALGHAEGARVCFPSPALCTDNGVMIAWAAGLRLLAGQSGRAAGAFTVRPRWPLSDLSPAC